MAIGIRLLTIAAILLATTACATTRARSLADRFVTRGVPAIDLGGPPVVLPDVSQRQLRDLEAALRAGPSPARAAAPPRTATMATTIEAMPGPLRRALDAVAVDPSAERHLAAAQAYVNEGIRDRAYDLLVQGIRLHRRNAALHDGVARLWRDWHQLDLALTAAQTAVFLAPDSAASHNTLGTVLWALGWRADATRAFETATRLAPDAWYAWENLRRIAKAPHAPCAPDSGGRPDTAPPRLRRNRS